MLDLELGLVVHDGSGDAWVYYGYRVTSVGSREYHFIRAETGRVGLAVPPWTYHASNQVTIERRFPDVRGKWMRVEG